MQTALNYRTNRDLFSNYYLKEHLPETEAWDEVPQDELQEAFDDIKDLWDRERSTAPKRNESQLEEKFIRPMFRKLGIPFEVEESTNRTKRRPDYGFFSSEDAARDAFERRDSGDDFYKNSVAVADAKRWGRPLDTRGSGEHKRDFENPSYQIHVYLQETPPQWAVLTNGQKWRLYYGPTSHRLDSYYEIDLPTILEKGDLDDFKYFYLFFRHGAFIDDTGGDCFLDDVYGESNVFAQELGDDLQDNIYEAIKILSEGFLQYPENDLDKDDLGLIHDSSLIYLYRLIFVLYAEAEGRELLDTSNDIYEQSYSLNSLKQEVAEELDGSDPTYRDWQDDLSSRLDELFTLIDQGSKSRGIPEEDLYIPAYNGGLFRTDPDEDDDPEAQFLANHTVGDSYLAHVIELLTRSQNDSGKIFVDYSSLDVRHLGSIYEGLLEYQLHVADEQLAIDDGQYVSAEEGDDIVVDEREVYLTTGSGERKATGSYYTPEYVVEYIVEETLGPLVDDVRENLAGQSAFNEGGFAKEFANRIFELKVLDPAMGSGHFLTSAVDFLAREIIDAQERQAEQQGVETIDKDRDINWARRKVAQRCIYGVDLNPLATELAKVSLWLRTLAAEQPLAFLDHHLKTGNSLVGSDIEEVLTNGDDTGTEDGQLTLQQSFAHTRQKALEHVMERFQDLLSIDNETLEDAKEMEDVYDDVRDDPLYQNLISMVNVHTAEQFGLDVPSDADERMAKALRNKSWEDIERQNWYSSAQKIADDERFFNWELEFPVAFYDEDGNRKINAGFDAIIGNPPYRTKALGKGQEQIADTEKNYYKMKYPNSSAYKLNTFPMFIDFSLDIIHKSGTCSMIVPKTLLTNYHYQKFRKVLLDEFWIESILDFEVRVFDDGETGGTIVPIISRGTEPEDRNTKISVYNEQSDIVHLSTVSQSVFQNFPNSKILLDTSQIGLVNKITKTGTPLGEISTIYNGIKTGNNDKFLSEERESDKHKKVIRGRDITRFSIQWGGNYVYFDQDELWSNTNREMFEACPKVVIRQTGENLVAAVDDERRYTLDTTHLIIPDQISVHYLTCLMNSNLMGWYYHQLVPEKNRTFAEVKGTNVKQLPIHINPNKHQYSDLISNKIESFIDNSHTESVTNPEKKGEKRESDNIFSQLTRNITQLKKERHGLNLSLLDYLGISTNSYPDSIKGEKLSEKYMPASGVTNTPLRKTAEDLEGLRVEGVSFKAHGEQLIMSVDLSYKPDNDDIRNTDAYGRLIEDEFETYEGMVFVGLSEIEETLLRNFVPVAVDQANGFAGFRHNATKTNTLLDRLENIILPEIEEVYNMLEKYVEVKKEANKLDEQIEEIESLINDIIYDLYDLTNEEISIIESTTQHD